MCQKSQSAHRFNRCSLTTTSWYRDCLIELHQHKFVSTMAHLAQFVLSVALPTGGKRTNLSHRCTSNTLQEHHNLNSNRASVIAIAIRTKPFCNCDLLSGWMVNSVPSGDTLVRVTRVLSAHVPGFLFKKQEYVTLLHTKYLNKLTE